VATIAAQLVHGKPPTRGPAWGGKRRLTTDMTLVVLPPTDPALVEELRQHLATLDPQMLLVASDTAEGGVNVVRLDIHKPRRDAEIFPPFYSTNLAEAQAGGRLYFTRDVPAGQLAAWAKPAATHQPTVS
jgi:hypothetical protein